MKNVLVLMAAILSVSTSFAGIEGFDCNTSNWGVEKCVNGKSYVWVCVKDNSNRIIDSYVDLKDRNFACSEGEEYPLKELKADLIRRSQLQATISGLITFPKEMSLYYGIGAGRNANAGVIQVKDLIK